MTTPLALPASTAAHMTGLQSDDTSRPSRRRPIPSPLAASETARTPSDASRSPPLSPNYSSLSPPLHRATHSIDAVPAAGATASPGSRVRAPNPAKRVPGNPALDEFRSAVTRDALREQEATITATISQPRVQRNISAPVLTAAHQFSPPASPTMLSSSKPTTATRAHPSSIMPRNPSIDSTVSTISNASTKVNGANAYRVSHEPSGPQDVAALIAAVGSPEGAIQRLIHEKNQAASNNAQLWRLVEKQRAMILGMNQDLEKTLKEKERYKRKLKDQLVQSQSAPVLPPSRRENEAVLRDESQSPTAVEVGAPAVQPPSMRDISIGSRKVSDTSDAASLLPGRSDTPQDNSNVPSSAMPATPLSESGVTATARGLEIAEPVIASAAAASQDRRLPEPVTVQREPVQSPPMSPRLQELQSQKSRHQKSDSASSIGSPPASAQSFSSPKVQASRKAPPAPLNLSSQKQAALFNVNNNIVDASDSEYEEDPDSARAEQMIRGRRKTREEDDREREATAQQEVEYRSRSKKDKKSKSKPPAEQSAQTSNVPVSAVEPLARETSPEQVIKSPTYQHIDPAAMLRHRALAGSAETVPKSSITPSLMSPGLPMSPRPGDRPMNSPLPRAPNKMLNSIPMSPKAGMAGLPLSPRAPRQPIPMPPQTPLSFASPHLARAEAYQQPQVQPQPQPAPSSLVHQVTSSPQESPDLDRPSTSSDPMPMTPGEIYRGLVTDQYPDLLLPPNALALIYVKTASSRMKPSRQSYITPKHSDDNPVFTLAVHERSDNKQLWRVEKTFAALAQLDDQVKIASSFRDRLPDKALFAGHAPAKVDARRGALDDYFNRMLDSITEERAAKIVCKYLSTDAIGASAGSDYFGRAAPAVDSRVGTPVHKPRPQREGYLTKRGKNFGGWKARYFIIDGASLKYFDARGGAQLGSIKLQNAQIGKQSNNSLNQQEEEEHQFRHAFLVLEPKKKDSSSLVRHVLCAESDEERDMWVDTLLQYVDYKDDEDDAASRPQQIIKLDISGSRSPRLQKSMNDLRPPSRTRDPAYHKPDPIRAVGYNDTVAGEAPVIGPSAPSARNIDTPSPPHDGTFGSAADQQASKNPQISGPTNLQVISNAGDWGMKPPPTPGQSKDKKRSIFAGFRGRSSSDLGPNDKGLSPGMAPDYYASGGIRAVFGVPLAEAVEFARPGDVPTELPAVVYRCIEYLLLKNAIAEEGIFRLSGSNIVIKALKDRFNTEGDIDLTADPMGYDMHAVASLLKLYLRELPSSILTRELHLEFLQCLEMHGKEEKVVALNVLVNKLPRPNRALLDALSAFLLAIVNNSEINKMNVRNGEYFDSILVELMANMLAVGIVFAPTLNVPAPLISSFVEDQATIFGPPLDDPEHSQSTQEISAPAHVPIDLRSPRKQMFSDLPTPAYNQTTFQSFGAPQGDGTGMIPMRPTYGYQMPPQGDGGYGSLNDALRSPTVYNTAANGVPSAREAKAKRRESSMLGFSLSSALPKKSSMSKLREEEGASF